jgi:hypothetical protein
MFLVASFVFHSEPAEQARVPIDPRGVSLSSRNRLELRPMTTVNLVILQPLVALIAGILILLVPRLLNYIVAIYLIVVGVTGLWPHVLR